MGPSGEDTQSINKNPFELHLQAYFIQGVNVDNRRSELILNNKWTIIFNYPTSSVKFPFSFVVMRTEELSHVAPTALIERVLKACFYVPKVLVSSPIRQLICCQIEYCSHQLNNHMGTMSTKLVTYSHKESIHSESPTDGEK